MGSSTIGFVSMKNIPSQPEFLETVMETVNKLIQTSYEQHGVGEREVGPMPLIRNQALPNHFEYNSRDGRETWWLNFSLFIDAKDFSSENAYRKFTVIEDGKRVVAEKESAIPNEARSLFILNNCMDHSDILEGPKMILSIGNWGQSERIIKSILDSYGAEYYIVKDDCSDDFERVEAKSETLA